MPDAFEVCFCEQSRPVTISQAHSHGFNADGGREDFLVCGIFAFEQGVQLTSPCLLPCPLLTLFSLVLYESQVIGESCMTMCTTLSYLRHLFLCISVLSINETQSWLQTSPEREMKLFSFLTSVSFLNFRHFYLQIRCLVAKSDSRKLETVLF